jgi:SAM-dependent methyltransferase
VATEELPELDDERLKDLLARIPAERCSAPRCGRDAVAVMQRPGRDTFVCVAHAERASRWGHPVFQPSADGAGVEQFVADKELIHSRWEENWSAAAYAPEWRMRAIPPEIRKAVDEAWFPAGGSVLDIGCGSGEIAAWLAQQGYVVLGIDFARAAVERARETYAEVPRLTFDVVDIRESGPPRGEFEALLDRGCLRVVGEEYAPAYVRNVAAAAKHGAPFLLLHPSYPDTVRDEWIRHLEELLGEAFEIQRIADTVFERQSGESGEEFRDGLALWMTRR